MTTTNAIWSTDNKFLPPAGFIEERNEYIINHLISGKTEQFDPTPNPDNHNTYHRVWIDEETADAFISFMDNLAVKYECPTLIWTKG